MLIETEDISQDTLLEILKSQPEPILIQLFDQLMVSSDTSPLTDEERVEIENAKKEYYNGETIKWKR